MRLFKRKHSEDEVALRCPNCHEHIPEGENECTADMSLRRLPRRAPR